MSKLKTGERMCAVSEDVLFWAFRYTLGRMTYAVKDVTTALTMNISNISIKTCRQIIDEIYKAEDDGTLGMDMDRAAWLQVRDILEKKAGNA